MRTYGDLMHVLGEHPILKLKDGATVRELIFHLKATINMHGGGLLGPFDLDDSTLMILVNGRNIRTMRKLETQIKDGDTVTFIPLVIGG